MDRSLPFRALSVSAGVLALVAACTSGGSGETPTPSNEAGADASTTSDVTTTEDRAAPPAKGKFSFTGSFDDPTLPPSGSKVAVVWNVFAGSPDYSYVFGGGTTSNADVYVTFTADPPAEALNNDKIGIGLVYVFDASFDLPEGKIVKSDASSPESVLKGISARHAVIFRNSPDQVTSAGWDLAFPQGFACGVCEDREVGFDAFIPIDCSQVKIVPFIKGTTKTCNFT